MKHRFSISRIIEAVKSSRWCQAGLIIALWFLVDRLTRQFHVPLPGAVVGLLLVWAMLESKLLSADWIENGANSLLRHLMLFFVPAMLGLVDHRELLSLVGLKLLGAVLVGTLLVMASTALIVEYGLAWSTARQARVRR